MARGEGRVAWCSVEGVTDAGRRLRFGPFEAELKYLARLWSHAGSAADFLGAYDYRISGKHELR